MIERRSRTGRSAAQSELLDSSASGGLAAPAPRSRLGKMGRGEAGQVQKRFPADERSFWFVCRLTHLGGAEEIGDLDAVSQDAERTLWVALDHVVVDAVQQRDHRVVCERSLDL